MKKRGKPVADLPPSLFHCMLLLMSDRRYAFLSRIGFLSFVFTFDIVFPDGYINANKKKEWFIWATVILNASSR